MEYIKPKLAIYQYYTKDKYYIIKGIKIINKNN